MATTTFDKNIVLDEEAAERLAKILAEPAPPRTKLDENFWEENERKKRNGSPAQRNNWQGRV